jgi:hypothetical protein
LTTTHETDARDVQRVVTLGEGFTAVKAAPPGQEFDRSLRARWSKTREEILVEFSDGLAERINRSDARFRVGRKWEFAWQNSARHLANKVNTKRLIVHRSEVPKEFRERLAARIYDFPDEY